MRLRHFFNILNAHDLHDKLHHVFDHHLNVLARKAEGSPRPVSKVKSRSDAQRRILSDCPDQEASVQPANLTRGSLVDQQRSEERTKEAQPPKGPEKAQTLKRVKTFKYKKYFDLGSWEFLESFM